MNFDLSNLGRSLTPPADDLCFPPVDPKDDGWTEWEGGECPIPHAKAGEWEVRSVAGRIETPRCAAVEDVWRPMGLDADIAAYRLKPAKPAATTPLTIGAIIDETVKLVRRLKPATAAEPIPAAEDRKTAQEYAAALHGDDDPVQDTDRPGIANAAMFKAMTTPKPVKPEPRDEPGLLTVAPMGSHARGWGL